MRRHRTARATGRAPSASETPGNCPSRLRCKSRLRTRLESGEEAGLFLERGTVLRGGDKLLANDGRVVEVVAAPEALLEARSGDAAYCWRAPPTTWATGMCAVQLGAGLLRYRPPTTCSAKWCAASVSTVHEMTAPFEPESGAYGAHGAHGHGHSADGEGRGPRIHDHFGR